MRTITLKDGTEVNVYFDSDRSEDDKPSIHIGPSPFCEHCMELEPYSLEFFDGGVAWCEDCMDHPITEDPEAMAHLKRWEREEQTKYLNARLKGLAEGPVEDEDWDEESERENHFSDIEDRLDTLENDLADLGERLKKIEDFLREQEMARRQDVITLGVVEEPRWVGPDPEDDPKMVQTGPDTWRTKE